MADSAESLLSKKLCVDCDFHRQKWAGYFAWDCCLHPDAAHRVGNVVTGFSREWDKCQHMRADETKCGLDAKWFKPRRSAIARWLDFNERFRDD